MPSNLLGIIDPDELEEAEIVLLEQLYVALLIDDLPDRALRVEDLVAWHRSWLGAVYEWAGALRQVNLSKGGFFFANAALVPRLLSDFETGVLSRLTPCVNGNTEDVCRAIATAHVELNLIHPFRDGNGRIARLLADVMALQAGCGPLDYTTWDSDKSSYFSAIREGQGRDYSRMATLVRAAIGE